MDFSHVAELHANVLLTDNVADYCLHFLRFLLATTRTHSTLRLNLHSLVTMNNAAHEIADIFDPFSFSTFAFGTRTYNPVQVLYEM